jgi:hypothetical protein
MKCVENEPVVPMAWAMKKLIKITLFISLHKILKEQYLAKVELLNFKVILY